MIESGILSAIGLAIESQCGKVPVTTLQMGAANNPARYFTVEPDGGIPAAIDMNIPYDEVDGFSQLKRMILQAKDYAGGFGFKVDPENIIYPLLGLMGKCVQTNLGIGSGTTPAFRHVFTPNIQQPSFSVETDYGSRAYGQLCSGYVINALGLTMGRTVMARMGGYALHQIPNYYPSLTNVDTVFDFTNASAALPWQMDGGLGTTNCKIATAPTYVDVYPTGNGNGPLTHGRMTWGSEAGFNTGTPATSGLLKINDVLKPFDPSTGNGWKMQEGFTLDMARDITTHHLALGGLDPSTCNANSHRFNGNAQFLYEDNTIPLTVLQKSKVSVNYKLRGITIPGNPSQEYSMEVHIPRARFLDPGVRMPNGAMTVPGDYACEYDVALGYAIKITTVDTFDMTSLAGLVSSNPGGLGGWLNA